MQNAVRLDNAGGFTAITTEFIQRGSRIYLVISLPICTFVLEYYTTLQAQNQISVLLEQGHYKPSGGHKG